MNNFIENCTGVILAGGENKRMPVLKGFIEVEGKKIIERNLKIMKQCFKETFIITNQPELYSYLDAPMFGDVYDIRGPMTGVFTALLNSSERWIFVSACDMPFINPALIRYMATERDNHDIVAPVRDNRPEPLFSFYSSRTTTSIERFILSGKRALKDFLLFYDKRVKYVTTEEIRKRDLESRSFINLNTPDDVDQYLRPEDRLKFKERLKRR
ncbi:MAG: molybdenum cofactor guanylyltransferase [Nitrospiraceae bacterium]|nr:MAG: molybdenum cofactor guanylyltransferase [Nitrospiraceae bacterium]